MALRLRKTAALAALLAPLALHTAPASAVDVANVVGGGTIEPGLPAVGCAAQRVTFTGTAVNVGNHTGVYPINFSGASGAGICETALAGSGSGTLSGIITGTVTYSRVGSVVTINGNVFVAGDSASILLGVCGFVPTSAAPATSYLLDCQVELA